MHVSNVKPANKNSNEKILSSFRGNLCFGNGLWPFLFLLIRSDAGHREETVQDFKTILVLGSKIEPDGQPASMTKNRLDTALTLAKNNPQARVIVTGYQSSASPVSEAEGMTTYLKAHGLNSDRIIEEKKARNTVENFAFSKSMCKGRH